MQRLPLPGPSSMGPTMAKPVQSSDFALRDILERWAGSDDTLKVVMMAKAEEDRLKQEVMRLEIRRTEMDMLKEAIRAGIQPHLIPSLFNSTQAAQQAIYTPISPTQVVGGHQRIPFPHPQQAPAYAKLGGQSSPRFLPKLDTANISQGHPPSAHTATVSGSNNEQRLLNGVNGDAPPQSAPPSTSGPDQDSNSLFFHHWQPPNPGSQVGQMAHPEHTRGPSIGEQPGSPTPRKRKVQQYHILNAQPSPSGQSRKSPSRGHARHRSEASGLHGRFSDPYMPPVVNTSFTRVSHDRDSPAPLAATSQNPTSHEIDLARKRKRQEAEEPASDMSAASTIPEEPTKTD